MISLLETFSCIIVFLYRLYFQLHIHSMYMSLTRGIIELFNNNSVRNLLLKAGLVSLMFTQSDSEFSILNQPLAQTDCYGNLVQFSISLTGWVGIVTFQWQRKPPGQVFTDIAGENNATLAVYDIGMYGQNTDGTEYRVIVADDYGITISDPAVLHINAITSITPAIVNSVICYGGSIIYTVFSQGTAVSYQWQSNSGSGWSALSDNFVFSGSATRQLKISNATTSQNGSYRVSIIFATLNQPLTDPTCIETSYSRIRNLIVNDQIITSSIYHR